jgi:hypothetical protein
MARALKFILAEVVSINPKLSPLAAECFVKIKLPTDKFHIRSFLHNAKSWQGYEARRIKAELKEYLK